MADFDWVVPERQGRGKSNYRGPKWRMSLGRRKNWKPASIAGDVREVGGNQILWGLVTFPVFLALLYPVLQSQPANKPVTSRETTFFPLNMRCKMNRMVKEFMRKSCI